MTVPNVVFIDTSVFDGQNYNYESSAFASFMPVAKNRGLTFLLPHPIELELQRHIKERVQEAADAMGKARRCAPFLKKWKHWTAEKEGFCSLTWELQSIAGREWKSFLGLFKVERLTYEHIRVEEVMRWYDAGRAPFGKGVKRKEFPDAFAVAMVSKYASRNDVPVAVISQDPDMRLACDLFPALLYYPSLPAYTEAILSEDVRLDKIRLLLKEGEDVLGEHFCDAFCELSFYPDGAGELDFEKVRVAGYEFTELRIVAIGETECSVAFDVRVSFEAEYSFSDSLTGGGHGRIKTDDRTSITGVAKMRFNETLDKLVGFFSLQLDEDDVCVELPAEDPYDDRY